MKFDSLQFPVFSFKILRLSICFFVLLFTLYSLLIAQTVEAVSISPLRHTVIVEPGEEQRIAFEVSNQSDTLQQYQLSVDAFSVDSQTGRPIFGAADEAESWLTFISENNFALSAKEKRTVFVKAVAPSGAEPKTHYLVLFAKELSAGGNVSVGTQVGSLIFLSVAGIVNEDLAVDYLAPDKTFLFFGSPIFSFQLSNKGNVSLLTKPTLTLTSMSGRNIGSYEINQNGRAIFSGMKLSGDIKTADISWRDVGLLRATLVAKYGMANKFSTYQTYIWYLPYWFFILLIVLVTSFFTFASFIKKRVQKI